MFNKKIKKAAAIICTAGLLMQLMPVSNNNYESADKTQIYYDMEGRDTNTGQYVYAEPSEYTHVSGITPIDGFDQGPTVYIEDIYANAGQKIEVKIRVTDNDFGYDSLIVWLDVDTRYFTYSGGWTGGNEEDPDFDFSPMWACTELNRTFLSNKPDYIQTYIQFYYDPDRTHVSGDFIYATLPLTVNPDTPDGVYPLIMDHIGNPGTAMCNWFTVENKKVKQVGLNPKYISGNVYVGNVQPEETTEPETVTTIPEPEETTEPETVTTIPEPEETTEPETVTTIPETEETTEPETVTTVPETEETTVISSESVTVPSETSVPEITTSAAVSEDSHVKILPGDISGDGKINVADAIKLNRYIVGGWNVEIIKENADVNGDKKINIADVIILRRYIAGGWNVQLKAPE